MEYSLFLSRADEALFSLGWQSSRDGVSIKIPVSITSLGWRQEGRPAKKKICHIFHEMSFLSSFFRPTHASMYNRRKTIYDGGDDEAVRFEAPTRYTKW